MSERLFRCECGAFSSTIKDEALVCETCNKGAVIPFTRECPHDDGHYPDGTCALCGKFILDGYGESVDDSDA